MKIHIRFSLVSNLRRILHSLLSVRKMKKRRIEMLFDQLKSIVSFVCTTINGKGVFTVDGDVLPNEE